MKPAFFLVALLVSGLFLAPSLNASNSYDVIDLGKACRFLVNQYVPEIGLLRAAYSPWVDDYNRTYINDNILAARALAVCGENELANEILTTLANQYKAYLLTGRHEALLGTAIRDIPRKRANKELGTIGNITIIAEVEGNETLNDWKQYADWLLIQALNSLIRGDKARASELFNKAMNMFDGRGFYDKARASTHQYSVYKLGLAVYVYRALGEPSQYRNIINQMLKIISKAQDVSNGGIHTEYVVTNENYNFTVSDTNVETTSIIILALYSDYPENIGNIKESSQNTYYYVIASITAVLGIVVATLKAIGSLKF